MKKILNAPLDFVDEMLDGILLAHPEALRAADDRRAVVRADAPITGKVGLATGGGSGHLPVFLGYVGRGLLDGCAVGNVFSSPSADQMLAVTRAINAGVGVLYVYGNYGGDAMNFDMATEMANLESIEVRSILVADDVASSPLETADRRRGVAGMVFAYKIAGAAAATGASLDEVEAITRRALTRMRSIGVALSPCTVPAAGKPTFSIGDDEMELGMGIHGEPGVKRQKLDSADVIADWMLERILEELTAEAGTDVAVLVNGMGATPVEELYILYRRVHSRLVNRGCRVHRAFVGEYATSLEMAGASLSLMELDADLAKLLDMAAESPFFVQTGQKPPLYSETETA